MMRLVRFDESMMSAELQGMEKSSGRGETQPAEVAQTPGGRKGFHVCEIKCWRAGCPLCLLTRHEPVELSKEEEVYW